MSILHEPSGCKSRTVYEYRLRNPYCDPYGQAVAVAGMGSGCIIVAVDIPFHINLGDHEFDRHAHARLH